MDKARVKEIFIESYIDRQEFGAARTFGTKLQCMYRTKTEPPQYCIVGQIFREMGLSPTSGVWRSMSSVADLDPELVDDLEAFTGCTKVELIRLQRTHDSLAAGQCSPAEAMSGLEEMLG